MFAIIQLLATFITDLFKSPRRLEVENLFLRHQLTIARQPRNHPEGLPLLNDLLHRKRRTREGEAVVGELRHPCPACASTASIGAARPIRSWAIRRGPL